MYSNPEGIYDLLKIEEMGANLVIVSSGVWGVAGWDIMRIRERCGAPPPPPVRDSAGFFVSRPGRCGISRKSRSGAAGRRYYGASVILSH